MNRYDIAHRFANQDFGKNGHLKSGNVSVDGRNYYSYSTVFGQWIDLEKKVVLIYIGSTSSSSSKHQLGRYVFPSDVHVFPYNDKYRKSYYGYAGCKLLYWNEECEYRDRLTLLNYFIDVQFREFEYITTAKSKGAEMVSYKYWNYAVELCSLYKDTTIQKWLKTGPTSTDTDKEHKLKKKMAKLLLKGERDVKTITDALFGEGVYQKYIDYCERFRKADRKKEQMEWLCARLKLTSPYVQYCESGRVGHDLTAKQIRNLTAKERIEWHFRNLMVLEWEAKESERNAKYAQRKRNAYKWIVGEEPVDEDKYSRGYKDVTKVTNRFNGEVYDLTIEGWGSDYTYWSGSPVYMSFEYDKFRKSENKEEWMRDFYAKCKLAASNIKAQDICKRVGAHTKQGQYSWEHYWVDDEYLQSVTTPEEYEICKEYLARQDKHLADEEAYKRAMEIKRQREEEERRRGKELQERLKQEQIQECLANGVEGGRNLWRFHYMSINEAKSKSNIPDFQFYDGGNVLMRFGMKKDLVETSMSIKLDIPTCKKFWKLINIWHKDPSKFKECKIDTHYSGTYTIVSYENDILTAGCHKIAYSEMERMYNAIIEHEKEAA